MAVSARSDRKLPETARVEVGLVDMRRGDGHPSAGSFLYQGDRLVTGWHSHDLHEINYALQGVIEVETAAAHYLLPPQQAVWIPAGLDHETTINTAVQSISVLFEPDLVTQAGDRARVLAMEPLLREMMLYAVRWPIGRHGSDAVADGFFATLANLVSETLDHETPLSLPTSSDPLVSAAMTYTQEHLASVSAAEVSRAVGLSDRSLRRQFHTETGVSWRQYLLQARLLLQVATDVGFNSGSAFTRSFMARCGETPSAYRRRLHDSPRLS
jgi:AraC-like DNA-binding protein